jgi:hypothetical protein
VRPDPKLGARRTVKDPRVGRLYAAANPECVACGEPGANAHHVLERDDGGDDVYPNFVVLCGSGTTGCHGAFHGAPIAVVRDVGEQMGLWGESVVERVERRDREWVARRIGDYLVRRRHDTIGYVAAKLGPERGAHYLRSRYLISDLDLARIVRPVDTMPR